MLQYVPPQQLFQWSADDSAEPASRRCRRLAGEEESHIRTTRSNGQAQDCRRRFGRISPRRRLVHRFTPLPPHGHRRGISDPIGFGKHQVHPCRYQAIVGRSGTQIQGFHREERRIYCQSQSGKDQGWEIGRPGLRARRQPVQAQGRKEGSGGRPRRNQGEAQRSRNQAGGCVFYQRRLEA